VSLEELIDLYLSGELDEAGTQELLRRLKEDPALQRQLLAAAREDWALRSAVKGRIALEGAERDARADAAPSKSGSRARLRSLTRTRRGGNPWPWIAAAAGILLVVTAWVALGRPRPTAPTAQAGRTSPKEPPALPAPPPAVEQPAARPPERGTPTPPPPPTVPELPPERPSEPRPEPRVPVPPAPTPPKKDAPPPLPPSVAPETMIVIGTLEAVKGQGFILAGGKTRPAQAREVVSAGQGLETQGGGSGVVLKLADGSRIELGEDTSVPALGLKAGKRITLARGALTAQVTPQPRGEPMVFETPHAEATVLGTALRLEVAPGEKGSTRLTVTEGRVRLKNLDGKAVDVANGHTAVAAVGAPLAARPLPKTILSEDFEKLAAASARWETLRGGFPATFSGRLEVDLSPRRPEWYDGGWGKVGGLRSRQLFPLPLRLTVDVELTQSHEDILPNVLFTPASRDEKASFRVDRRGGAASLLDASSGLMRSVDVPARWPGRERWVIEIEGDQVGVWVEGRQVLEHRHGLKVSDAYLITLQANARSSVPPGSAVRFDNIRVEHLPLK